MSEKQLSIDWSRSGQLKILRLAIIPPVEIIESGKNRNVSPATIMLVLRAIDDHGQGCWASLDTLARETGLTRRSIIRAVAAMTKLSIICTEKLPKRGGGFSNHYTISWNELGLLADMSSTVPQGPNHSAPGSKPQCPRVTQSVRVKRPLKQRGRAGCYPRYQNYDFFDNRQIVAMYDATIAEGHEHNFKDFVICVVSARRRGRSPSGLLVTMLRDGWGEHPPTIEDTQEASRIISDISGFSRQPQLTNEYGNEQD